MDGSAAADVRSAEIWGYRETEREDTAVGQGREAKESVTE
jgi:hypothetical protein